MNTKICVLSQAGHRSVRAVLTSTLRRDGAEDAASPDVYWHGACLDVPSRRNQ